MDKKFFLEHWYAEIYEQQENQTMDVDFMINLFSGRSLNILEVCCGGGRISIPLAQAGHVVTGFDYDEAMLARLSDRAKELDNIQFYRANAVTEEWGQDFDVVILGGNILINIETALDYKQAQQNFINKSAECLQHGGVLLLDFNLFTNPSKFFNGSGERIHFDGRDSLGTYGRYIGLSSEYYSETQMVIGKTRTEITLNNGENFIIEHSSVKHIPTLGQVNSWLKHAGFEVLSTCGDYLGNPISHETDRAIILAKKI